MQITYEKFIEIVTEKALHEAGVHAIPRAHKIAVTQYCSRLSMRGACLGECDTCALHIRHTVDWIVQLPEKPKQPYGLYTYLLKNSFALRVEEVAKKPRIVLETNFLGERTGRDALDIFMEKLDAG